MIETHEKSCACDACRNRWFLVSPFALRSVTRRERVETELSELTERRHKLGSFLENPPSLFTAMEATLLTGQYAAMEAYEQFLHARLAIWREP